MSRPQFPINASQNAHIPGPIVNGGLIDFQDNYQRGIADYAQFMAAHQQTYGATGGNLMFPQPTFTPTQLQQGVVQGLPQSTLLGHPSFINVAGKMYKPVEESLPEVKRPVEAAISEPRPITDEDVDRRVKKRLDEWASSQRGKHTRSSCKIYAEEDRAVSRVRSVNSSMLRGKYSSPA